MGNLFDLLDSPEAPNNWVPPTPPQLDGVNEIYLDTETTGLAWWEKDRPIGIALGLPSGQCLYLPWAHRGGGNLCEETVKRWAQTELRGKRITNLNTRFDVHMLRSWDVDLEAQGCTVSDVGHYAALLDDHRKSFSLESISQDYLGIGKEQGLDKTRMASYPAWQVASYAEQDVRLVGLLRDKMWPLLDEQDLQRVRQLEDEVIFVVCEMEKNGALLNHELLDRWIVESEIALTRCLLDIHKLTGFNINPASPQDKTRLFNKLNLPMAHTSKGAASFTDVVLKMIDHPVVRLLQRASKLTSLRSKYLLGYRNALDSHGILRYALHQLRAKKSDADNAGESGTVSGRFSSTEIQDDVGANIQQVFKVVKQRGSFGYAEDDETHDDEIFIIRKLFVPTPGSLFLSDDAMQIEQRIFASFAKTPSVLKAYRENPLLSFHELIHGLLLPYKPGLTYKRAKDCSFAKIYGAGTIKLAEMLEFITGEEAASMRNIKDWENPKLLPAKEINKIYNTQLPEVPVLLEQAKRLAEDRGYVRTLLGRRARFPGGQRSHKALNSVIQGGAADIMKTKLVELHKARKDTGFLLRFTVHDEVDGDVPNLEAAARVGEILNSQSFPDLAVPILWKGATGQNWAACK